MGYTLKFKMLLDEAWFGANINDGWKLPMTKTDRVNTDTRYVKSCNQATPLWVSTKGRYLWSEDGYLTRWKKGRVKCTSSKSEIKLHQGFETLRGAYLAAASAHFPFDGTMPNEMMFRVPQYCTWIHLATNQNQKDILSFANGILEAGMQPGELIIDDGWQTDFGNWTFHPEKFDDPKEMIDKLHAMGFKVILWICPFVAPNVPGYAKMIAEQLLVRSKTGKVASRIWWNGKHPLLDLSNPKAVKWFQNVADGLIETYGVDGFKQDAGDSYFYKDNDKTFRPDVDANTQSLLWAETAKKYEFNELRACFKGGGWGITQRLGDKTHNWESNGLNTLIPNALLQGICGYPYSCPDMIGGGEISSFKKKTGDVFGENKQENEFDIELLIRWAQCSALMPMMQYSFALWQLKSHEARTACIHASKIHEQYADLITNLARQASTTGEPIIRSLEYAYPQQGYEKTNDMFLLGDALLVAPVVQKGARSKDVILPVNTRWIYLPNGQLYEGGQTVCVDAPLDVLPLFQLAKE